MTKISVWKDLRISTQQMSTNLSTFCWQPFYTHIALIALAIGRHYWVNYSGSNNPPTFFVVYDYFEFSVSRNIFKFKNKEFADILDLRNRPPAQQYAFVTSDPGLSSSVKKRGPQCWQKRHCLMSHLMTHFSHSLLLCDVIFSASAACTLK